MQVFVGARGEAHDRRSSGGSMEEWKRSGTALNGRAGASASGRTIPRSARARTHHRTTPNATRAGCRQNGYSNRQAVFGTTVEMKDGPFGIASALQAEYSIAGLMAEGCCCLLAAD